MYKKYDGQSDELPDDGVYKKILDELGKERIAKTEHLENPSSTELSIRHLPSKQQLGLMLDDVVESAGHVSSFEEISDIFFSKINVLSYPNQTIDKDGMNHFKFYRARKLSDIGTGDLRMISTFATPPPAFCNSNGRANLAGYPVFYCSDSKYTSIFELKPKVGEVIILTEWQMVSEYDINITGVIPENLPDENTFSQVGKLLNENYLREIMERFPDKREQLLQLNDFWINTFLNERPPYTLSSWFAHLAIYNDDRCDMLVYPSYETGQLRCNIAMHPNFVAKYLRMNKAYELVLMKDPEHGLLASVIKEGFVETRNIKWYSGMQSSKEGFEKF